MNLRQVVELTGIISAHCLNLIEAPGPLPHEALDRYRDCSHLQIKGWRDALDELPREIVSAPAALRHAVWQRAETTLADVLVGGLVARVWGAVLTASDRTRRTLTAERVARDVLAAQLPAQQGVLRLLVEGPHLTLERVTGLDRFRRKVERWTDLLLGHLVRRYALADFAFDVERALDFGEEQVREGWGLRHNRMWDLYLVCLRSAFGHDSHASGIQQEWREALFQSIWRCFPADLFLDDGLLKSVGLQRLLTGSLRNEGPPVPGRLAGARLGSFWHGGRPGAGRKRRREGE